MTRWLSLHWTPRVLFWHDQYLFQNHLQYL